MMHTAGKHAAPQDSLPQQHLPLIRHYAPATALAWIDRAVSPQQFIALARKLAVMLPEARHVINLCEDRYFFLLGFAAALIADRITLTPASRATEAIARIQREFAASHVITDSELAGILRDLETVPATAGEQDWSIPKIPAARDAIILFTSGSSGQPTAHRKTWGMLVQGADELQRAFDVSPGSCVLGTVPPQHMFGLESTIVFPLQWGCTIHHLRPLLPADIEQTVNQAGKTGAPVWLMTTPVHLRACVSEGLALTGIAGAISATMPLDRDSAIAAENILHCPLHEIYGCTEAGLTATRRPARDMEWQLSPDFRLRAEGEQVWLEGARVTSPLLLADHIDLHAPRRFSLLGRVGDMLKIAGKRTSLTALNAELLAIDGVVDGCFYRPEADEGHGDDRRLTAFVVAPKLSAHDVLAELRKRIDAVFVPRPLRKVAQLPRDANGKLSRESLQRLATMPVELESADCVTGVITADHPALDGHFPGNPVVPGVLLLNEVIRLAARSHRIGGVMQVKFLAPLRPGQSYAISLDRSVPGAIKFAINFVSECERATIASGSLYCETRHEEK